MSVKFLKYFLYVSAAIIGSLLILFLVSIGYLYSWTGFGGYIASNPDAVRSKTLWDWMELLIIPVVLAGGAFLLNRSERALERKIAEDHARLERDLATDRQREMALQTYFDRMSDLLLNENLRTTNKAEVRDVARTRTLSVLRSLDGFRKTQLFQFLIEAKLVGIENPVIELYGADLSDADIQGKKLKGANLSNANLSNTNLTETDLSYADLSDVDLKQAILIDTNLYKANLSNAWLSLARMGGANLRNANLSNADLMSTILIDADLTDADLSDTNLSKANLKGAIITEKQLASAWKLSGATMPDNTKRE